MPTHPAHAPEPATFTDGAPLPRVLIFDLDYTLWPFWVDTHVTPPIRSAPDGATAMDRYKEPLAFYAHVPALLAACRARGILVAAASRTHAPPLARELLSLLRVEARGGGAKARPAREFFDALEIYPGDKTRHMDGIRRALGVPFEDALFFDDEQRNANVERERGVCFWLVRDGVTREEVDRGVRKWRERRGL